MYKAVLLSIKRIKPTYEFQLCKELYVVETQVGI